MTYLIYLTQPYKPLLLWEIAVMVAMLQNLST